MAKTPRTFRFTDAELEMLDELSASFGGDKTATIVDALAMRKDRGEPSDSALLAMLSKRLRGAGRGKLP